ncbi:D-alanyl-D-alanine carboxypeptidase family protein [Streptomyces sp. NPDC053560]|uniref:D-alanyl-D-alanine carboxypeptidase family protein n=1 Tax=Streptomyces sp. NPDC053560 TaxID=3365711 RepID=UPI0037D392ED
MGTDTASTRTTGTLTAIAVAGALLALPAPAHAAPTTQGRALPDSSAPHTAAWPEPVRPGAFLPSFMPRGPAAAAPAGISAKAWTVTDATTGQVVGSKQPHRQLAPASTLKTLFALTVLPKFPADMVRTVTAADLKGVGEGSSLVGIKKGQRYTVADLWRGVFLRSGNDAVHVLASMNGGWQATAKEMQAKARTLGADDTTVKTPDGYDAAGQVSSASDLTLFARKGLQNADFARYCGTVRATFPGGSKGARAIVNTNRMLSGTGGVNRYPGIIGVKNGYTSKAGNTLIAAAKRNGRTLVVTVLDPKNKKNAVYKEAAALLNWGFKAG